MTTVYLVLADEYEDEHVIGVFSSREKAKAAMESYNTRPNIFDSRAAHDIVEHEIDHMDWIASDA